jgi:23S rRNA (cytosine1962-C5)-methyltransferase
MVQSNEILLYTPQHWEEYALIDSGDREKLERFGRYVLIRPEPQAVWRKALSDKEWASMAHARYHRTKGVNQVAGEAERGTWQRNPGMPEQWTITYRYSGMNLTFRLGLTAFGHIGVFPEQASNWDFIYDSLRKSNILTPRILNLFAYTGGASVAARAAGARSGSCRFRQTGDHLGAGSDGGERIEQHPLGGGGCPQFRKAGGEAG